ncbi:glycosyltransferase [Synechococcus sp. BL107]|uniref:glycosyltransferase n=1 Tax=Synechococcus sp. BL107 TaxID=313625 RepID=UPI0002FFE783|nr:glycosyltransferase [Synechococcus sp. BL107]
MSVHYWLALHPDITRPIGGVKQMHRLAESIVACGRKATIIQESADFHPGWFSSNVNTISFSEWVKLRDSSLSRTHNVIIFPETFLTTIFKYAAGFPSVIFNQNLSYTFGLSGDTSFLKPNIALSLYRHESILQVFCVSQHDYKFLSEFVLPGSNRVSLIINGFDLGGLPSISNKKRQIVYMPRKNLLDGSVVASILRERSLLSGWTIKPIDGLAHTSVIELMSESFLFLSFGHPEGFGLPVAEALACGCAVVGYSGLGGRELFNLGSEFSMASEVAFGDWADFVNSVEDFELSLCQNPDRVFRNLTLLSAEVRSRYSLSAMQDSVSLALDKVEASL